MMSVLIEHANASSGRWSAWVVASLLDSALVLGLVGLIWLAIRRRVSPQLGYALFLMVPLKLLVPPTVALPGPLASRTPSALVASWFETPRTPSEVEPLRPFARPNVPRAGPRPEPVAPSPAIASIPRTMGGLVESPRSGEPAPIAAAPVAEATRPSWSTLALIGWAVGASSLLARLIVAQVAYRSRLRRLPTLEPASLPVDWSELCRLAGVRPTIRLVEDPSIAAPGVWGIGRPTVILPPGMGSALSPGQWKWVLLHELAHVRRRDLVVVAFQRVVAIVQFFNPAVWVANRMIDRLREYACDDLAASLGRSSGVEAGEAFVRVLRHAGRARPGLAGAGLGVFGFDSRSSCLTRVRRLLDGDRPLRTSLGPWSLAGLGLLGLVALPHVRGAVAPAQAPANPQVPAQDSKDFELTVAGPGGAAVPGATVEIRTDPDLTAEKVRRGAFVRNDMYGMVARADAEGKLTLAIPSKLARFNVHIAIPGFGPYWAKWSADDHDPEIPSRFTAELERAWSAGGIVVDAGGKPVRGVQIRPSIEFKKRPGDFRQLGSGARVTTDEQGRWRFDSVPESLDEVYVEVDHPDSRPLRPRLSRAEFGIKEGQAPSARIVMDRGLAVTGKVTDGAGKPIAGALVRTKFNNEIREAKTGVDGTYRLLGCEERPARLVVSATGKATDMKEVNVETGMGPVDFRMEPGGTVRIRVVDGQGRPMPKARIFFQAWRGRYYYFEFDQIDQYADANGVWEWHEAPLDEFRADICPPRGEGMQLVQQPLIARAEEYVFRLPPPLVISGRAIDAETKRPIREFRVVPGAKTEQGRLSWSDREAFKVTDGRYEVREDRLDGALLVRVEADGYVASTSREIAPTEGSVTIDVELKRAGPEQGVRVAAKVVTPDLKPASGAEAALGVPGAQIDVKNGRFDNGTFSTRTVADDAGRLEFPAQDQPFQLLIVHPAGFAQIRSTPDWGPVRIIRLEPWAKVEGTFRVGKTPAPGVSLELDVAGHDTYGDGEPRIFTRHSATTGPDGRYSFPRVIPGRGSIGRSILLLVDEGATEVTSSCKVPAEFPAGKTTRLDLGGTGRAVVGRLLPAGNLYPKDVRWNFAFLRVRPEPKDPDARVPYLTATVARDGTFRIDDVPPGDYTLDARFDRGDAGVVSQHRFRVDPADKDADAPAVDLGTLKLRPRPR